MSQSLRKFLLVLLLGSSLGWATAYAQNTTNSQAVPNWFDPTTWYGMFNIMPGTMPGQSGINFAQPSGWASFINPMAYPQLMNPATYSQFMTPQFYMQFADPNTWMNWMNPASYYAFMNPATYMQWMNPMSYMQFMNPGLYMQMMNPANYAAYMSPTTYMQWMNPAAYTIPMGQAGSTSGAATFNWFDPAAWMSLGTGSAVYPAPTAPQTDTQ